MTARKPASKAAPRKGRSTGVEGRVAKLESDLAQLRAEHDVLSALIQQAIVAQVQQQLANFPETTRQALAQHLLLATNGATP